MHLKSSARRVALLVTLAVVAAAAPAGAQSYPSKPVKLLVPFPPGGPADVLGRIFAQKLGELWGQAVVVDNRAGAGGNLGADIAARSAPDGYTLILIASSHVINASLYSKLPYDPIKDFTPISQVAYYSLVLVTHPSVPVHSLKELVALAKTKPGQLTCASAGSGTPTHLTAELFKLAAGIDVVHVPYKGAAPATNDLLGGQVQMMFNNPVSALPHVKTGKLRALATTGAKRSPVTPDLPTIAELGYPGFEAGTWFAFLGPAGLPREIVTRLHTDLIKVLQLKDVRERLAAQAIDPLGSTPEQLAAIMKADLDKWAKVIRAAHITAD